MTNIKSEVMKRAWRVYKAQNFNYKKGLWSFSKCLTEAWKTVKAETKAVVKAATASIIKGLSVATWFLRKNLTANEVYAVETAYSLEATRETEKAYLVKADTKYGVVTFWAPKSVCSFAR